MKISKCDLCESEKYTEVITDGKDYEYNYPGKFTLVQCECGLFHQNPKPELEDLDSFYPDTYCNYSPPANIITKALSRLYIDKKVKEIVSTIGMNGTILDVGCADGQFLLDIRGQGNWQLKGLELKYSAAEKGRKNGLDVIVGTLESVSGLDGSFDLIRMNHILEHVISPTDTIAAAKRLLKKGGYIIGETPNIESPDFYLFKKYWGALHLPRHITLFSPATLQRLMEKNGMKLVSIGYSLHTCGWALGCQNYLVSKLHLKPKDGRTGIYPILLCLFVPFTMLEKLLKRTGIITFIAQKV